MHHSAVRCLRALKHGNWDGRRVVPRRSRRSCSKFACLLSVADDVGGAAQAAATTTTTRDKKLVNKKQQHHQGSNSSSSTEKHEFDDIQDLIVSPPTVATTTKGSKKAAAVGAAAGGGIRELPTLLEREARALEGSSNFSRRERNEAVNGLLDLLEQKGVTPGYAFEFVRYAGELIDILIAEAKQTPGKLPPPPLSPVPSVNLLLRSNDASANPDLVAATNLENTITTTPARSCTKIQSTFVAPPRNPKN